MKSRILILLVCLVLLVGCSSGTSVSSSSSSETPAEESASADQSGSSPSQSSPDSPALSDEQKQAELAAALENITLENYPDASDESIAKFKEHIATLDLDQALAILQDDPLVYSMLLDSYWGL